jgi:hypothetical protein
MVAAAEHNGGRSQLGLNFVQTGQEWPFLNLLKGAQFWTLVDNSGHPAPDTLSADGYPISFSGGGVKTVFYIPTQDERPGRYAITWAGSGTVYTGFALSAATGAKTAGGGPGGTNRYEFLPGTHRVDMGIVSGDVTDLKFFHVDDETALNSGEVFSPRFIEKLIEINPGVLRFLDWQFGNPSNVTTWDTRKPVSYFSYAAHEFRATLYGGVTGGSGDTYTCSAPPGWSGLNDKAQVIVKFDRSASGDSATLNVGGTGAKTIKQQTGNTTTSGSNTRCVSGEFGILTYDAVLDCWLKRGGDLANADQALVNAAPYELMVQLAAQVGAHPHFVTPYLTADPLTDFMPSLAAYCRDNGPSWMVPRFEGPNEIFNNLPGAGFYASSYGGNKSFAHWGVNNYHQWYGKVASVLGQAISTVYGADRTRYWVLAGVQTGLTSTSDTDPHLTAASYVAQAAAAQSPYLKDAAYKWVTHVCIATYITPTGYSTLDELRGGFNYTVTYAGDEAVKRVLADEYAATLTGSAAIYNLAYMKARYEQWATWAAGPWPGGYVLGLTAYEGGYSPDYSAVAWSSAISAATKDAGGCVLTLATTSGTRGSVVGGGNAAVVGMSLTLASVGGMTELNGNTYTVTGVGADDGLSDNQVRINVDSSGFSTYTSGGTATYVNAPLYTNTLRHASKFSGDQTRYLQINYRNFTNAGGVFPSQFLLAGTPYNIDTPVAISSGGQVWNLLDPSVWGADTPAFKGVVQYNEGRRTFKLF